MTHPADVQLSDPSPSERDLSAPDVEAMPAARTPVASGRITAMGAVLALILIGIGVVGVRDALVSTGLRTGRSWIDSSVDSLHHSPPQWWMVPVGGLSLLIGLWLLITALRPRPRTAARLRSRTGVFVRPRDIGRLAAGAAEDVDGVARAGAKATRRSVKVSATVTGVDPAIDAAVQQAVEDRLSGFEPPLRIRVTSRSGWDR